MVHGIESVAMKRRERGVSMIIVAMLLVTLLVFAALAIDISNARQIRRQAQSAADASALAAASALPNFTAAVTKAKTYASSNFGVNTSTGWLGCTDSSALSYQPDSGNSCISFDSSTAPTRARVRIPTRQVTTYFGAVVGTRTINVSASATAFVQPGGGVRVLPTAVTSAMGTGNLCVENSGSDQSCAARSSGNFGSLAPARLNLFITSNNQEALSISYAMNLDHDVNIYSSGTKVCDGATTSPCSTSNTTSSATANHMNVMTGNVVDPVTRGMVTGFSANTTDQGSVTFCGRLARPDASTSTVSDPQPSNCTAAGSPTINALGTTINGRHIYYWMQPWARAVFYPEVTSTTLPVGNSAYDAGDTRLDCFVRGYRYNSATGAETIPSCAGVTIPAGRSHVWPMFNIAMPNDPRFGVVPVVASWPSGSSTATPLSGYWAEYTYRLYTSSTKLKAFDGWVFDPALIDTSNGVPGIPLGARVNGSSHLVQ